jgi:photosystem II stability/assembly factor-like uncharacterized protein
MQSFRKNRNKPIDLVMIGCNKTPTSTIFTFIVLLVLLLLSCNKSSDPSIEVLEEYNFGYSNISSIAVGGEYLQDSLYVDVNNQLSPTEVMNYKVEFEVLSGGGSIDKPIVLTRKDGKASTRWKLGTSSFRQTASSKIFSPDGKFLCAINYNAFGKLYNAWNEVDYYPLSNLSDLAADTVNHLSWMIASGGVYKQGSDFLDWQRLNEPKLNCPREIEIDKNGVVYIDTWNGELYKSTDHGTTWIKCTNPIPDRPYFFYFWITNDGDLWATHYERGLWHSKDGGMTWLNPIKVSGTNFHMSGAFRLKNGWLVSQIDLTGVKSEIMKSEDDGITWSPLTTPDYPYCYFVTDDDEIIVCTQGMSAGIHKSTDLGKTYKLVHSVPVTFGTGSQQTYFHKFGSDYYMAVPGFGVLKTQNFEQFETFFNEPNINGLYIDHTGNIVVMGWNEKMNRSFFYGRK